MTKYNPSISFRIDFCHICEQLKLVFEYHTLSEGVATDLCFDCVNMIKDAFIEQNIREPAMNPKKFVILEITGKKITKWKMKIT